MDAGRAGLKARSGRALELEHERAWRVGRSPELWACRWAGVTMGPSAQATLHRTRGCCGPIGDPAAALAPSTALPTQLRASSGLSWRETGRGCCQTLIRDSAGIPPPRIVPPPAALTNCMACAHLLLQVSGPRFREWWERRSPRG